MAAHSKFNVTVGVGAGVAFVLFAAYSLRHHSLRRVGAPATQGLDDACVAIGKGPANGEALPQDGEALPQDAKTRVGGMKVSKVARMLDEMAEASGAPLERVPAAPATTQAPKTLSWDEEIAMEKATFEEAARIVRGVRQSVVHRKLPHFHATDRQLRVLEEQLANIAVNVKNFWRYGRDEPMAKLLELPMLRLAATKGEGALLPVSLGFVKHTVDCPEADHAESQEDLPSEDALLLGIALGADAGAVESAYRRRSRHFHRHGMCCNVRGFNALTFARNRCLARLSMPELRAYGGGGDLVAHYLLMGLDPGESRYREYTGGILDGVHRDRIMQCMQVLLWPCWDIPLTWGDDDDGLGFGGQSPWASG